MIMNIALGVMIGVFMTAGVIIIIGAAGYMIYRWNRRMTEDDIWGDEETTDTKRNIRKIYRNL